MNRLGIVNSNNRVKHFNLSDIAELPFYILLGWCCFFYIQFLYQTDKIL